MDANDESMRVFFALWPKRKVRAALAAWQPHLQPLCGGLAMREDGLHTTLAFLGEITTARLEALKLAAQEVEFESFELYFDMARYWGHNHIAFAAPSQVPMPLLRLVEELEQRLVKHHFHFERRVYKPHVTLLRHANWTDDALPHLSAVVWLVRDFVLVRSMRDDQGTHYEVLARFGASELE